MLFLLPPSETKRVGGLNLSLQQVGTTFGGLNEARDIVRGALVDMCGDQARAAKVLKLSAKQLHEIDTNLKIDSGAVMPAYQRYSGTLYEALVGEGLSSQQLARLKELVLIQSALFGLISASDLIPAYRLSATTIMPNVSLRDAWVQAHESFVWPRLKQTPIIDLRSKAYVALAPIPDGIESFYVDVLVQSSDGSRKPMNHFNKKSKGLFMRGVLSAAKPPSSLPHLAKIAETANLGFEVDGSTIMLISDGIV
jgi:cytoplasmic iron level regulating protein YaaA (DUF328/UPF0246 family)